VWNERRLALHSDNRLSYYEVNSTTSKGVYDLCRCEKVSELFVSKYLTHLVYSVQLNFAEMEKESDDVTANDAEEIPPVESSPHPILRHRRKASNLDTPSLVNDQDDKKSSPQKDTTNTWESLFAMTTPNKRGKLIVASSDYELMQEWKAVFDAAMASTKLQGSTWGLLFRSEGKNAPKALWSRRSSVMASMDSLEASRPEIIDAKNLLKVERSWRPVMGGWASYVGVQGIRIFTEDSNLQSTSYPCAPVKSQTILSTSALNAFLCLMSFGCDPSTSRHDHELESEQGFSFHVIETIDEHTDIIHMVCRPLFLFPVWSSPRDFVLYRFWRLEPDGTYMVCYDSVDHVEYSVPKGFVRGKARQCFTISPSKSTVMVMMNVS